MKTTIVRMTLTNESVAFTKDGIYIQPVLSDRFRFAGSVEEFFSIMIYHTDIDISIPNVRFYVRESLFQTEY